MVCKFNNHYFSVEISYVLFDAQLTYFYNQHFKNAEKSLS
jgi:NADH:ubiquinone oxidoreductase subunit 3 (subunit A)